MTTVQAWGPDPARRATDLARSCLDAYGIEDADLQLISISENATFAVVHGDSGISPTILRVHRLGYSTPREIDSELAWMQALRQEAGVLAPEVIPTRDGLLRGSIDHLPTGDIHSHVMFELCPGVEPAMDDMLGSMLRLGEINASMHLHSRSWVRPEGFTRRTWNFDTMLGTRSHWGRWQDGAPMSRSQLNLLQTAASTVQKELDGYGESADRFGLIHGDFRPANVLVSDRDTFVIDFDDCGFGWFLYDAATALTGVEHHDEAPKLLRAWEAGYLSSGTLTEADYEILPTFLMLRRMLILAWFGSHMHSDSDGAGEYLDGTCALAADYLRGELRWL